MPVQAGSNEGYVFIEILVCSARWPPSYDRCICISCLKRIERRGRGAYAYLVMLNYARITVAALHGEQAVLLDYSVADVGEEVEKEE